MYGILNIDKPSGQTSRDIVNEVLRELRPARLKAGHAGTLDPLATGVLLVCLGPATRLVPFLHEWPKRYVASFRFGLESNTDDIEGEVIERCDATHLTADAVTQALPQFVGTIQQVPPAFSAIKIDGQRAYKAARSGKDVELEARSTLVHRIDLLAANPPDFQFEIECGSGTYIRAIGRDLGNILGTGAVMTELRRTAIGPFHVDTAHRIDRLTRGEIPNLLEPAARAVEHLPAITISQDEHVFLSQGRTLADRWKPSFPSSSERRVAIFDESGVLIAVGEQVDDRIQPRQVFIRAID